MKAKISILLGLVTALVALPSSKLSAQFPSFKKPRSPVEIKLPSAPTRLPVPKPTGPRVTFTPRPVGLPKGTRWPEIRPKTPKTFKTGGSSSRAFEKARKSIEARMPKNGVQVGTSSGQEGDRGRTEVGGMGSNANSIRLRKPSGIRAPKVSLPRSPF